VTLGEARQSEAVSHLLVNMRYDYMPSCGKTVLRTPSNCEHRTCLPINELG
jgi:hypothetical protein